MNRPCDACGEAYEARRATSRYCSERCRKRAARRHGSTPPPPIAILAEYTPLVVATKREIDEAGLRDTTLGQQAVALAVRMVNPFDTGSAMAAVSREFRAVMGRVTEGTPAADAVDMLRARRDEKLREAMSGEADVTLGRFPDEALASPDRPVRHTPPSPASTPPEGT